MAIVAAVLLVLLPFAPPLHADESLAGIACRSVHLVFPAEEADAFLQIVVIERSAPGSYFVVCGWGRGYFGLQELADGKKLLLFSVWDSASNDPEAATEADRVQVVFSDPAVRVQRFGGEGSGGQCFFDFDWKPGTDYQLLVTARPRSDRTDYTGWFRDPAAGGWRKLITFSARVNAERLEGLYSFVEDFRRNRRSAGQERMAWFGPGWVRRGEQWFVLESARFTADANPAKNINAGMEAGRFFLATGGATREGVDRLDTLLHDPQANERTRPETPREE